LQRPDDAERRRRHSHGGPWERVDRFCPIDTIRGTRAHEIAGKRLTPAPALDSSSRASDPSEPWGWSTRAGRGSTCQGKEELFTGSDPLDPLDVYRHEGRPILRREDARQMTSLRKKPASLRSGSLPSKRDNRRGARPAIAHSPREYHGRSGDPTPSIPIRKLAWRQAESPTQGFAHEWFAL
jgi:hypothetical protein